MVRGQDRAKSVVGGCARMAGVRATPETHRMQARVEEIYQAGLELDLDGRALVAHRLSFE